MSWPSPTTLSEHAIDRWCERWRSALRRTEATTDLIRRIGAARFVEEDASNAQAIWAFEDHDGAQILLVVDMFGDVRTVLPRGATRSDRRPQR